MALLQCAYPYVRGITRSASLGEVRRLADELRRQGQTAPGELEQVLGWLADLDERIYHNWQRRASDMIAENVWQDLLRLRSSPQPDGPRRTRAERPARPDCPLTSRPFDGTMSLGDMSRNDIWNQGEQQAHGK